MELMEITEHGLPIALRNGLSFELREWLTLVQGHYHWCGYRPPWISYCMVDVNDVSAWCMFHPPVTDDRIELSFYTCPAYRRNGVATELLQKVLQQVHRVDSHTIITARTSPDNVAANKTLKKAGFFMVGISCDAKMGAIWSWQCVTARCIAHDSRFLYQRS